MVQETERTRSGSGGRVHRRRWVRGAGENRRLSRAVLAATWLVAGVIPGLVVTTPGTLAAQDAAACTIPERQAPVTAPAASPVASPAGIADEIEIVPIQREDGTPRPILEPTPTGAPAEDPLGPVTTELTEVAHALAACLTEGDAELVSTLATERYLGQLYGSTTPISRDDYLALAPELDPVETRIQDVTNVMVDDDRATADVTTVIGRQLLVFRWSFVQAPEDARDDDESRWQVDQEEVLPFDPPANASEVIVAISDYEFDLAETTIQGPDVVLSGRNAAGQDHELLVLRLDDGVTTQDLLRGSGPGLPDGITYVGQATVPAADRQDLTLVGLEPGTYTVVCLFLTPEGIPHLAQGMEATFTVEE